MLRRHQIFWHSLVFFTKGKDHLSKCKHFITGSIKSNKNCFGVSTHTHTLKQIHKIFYSKIFCITKFSLKKIQNP